MTMSAYRTVLTVVCICIIVLSCGKDDSPTGDDTTETKQYASNAYFTTGFDTLNSPVDNLDTVSLASMDADTLYLYVVWFDFDLETITYRTEWKYEDGTLANVFESAVDVPGANWYTWTWHVMDSVLDRPGTWSVKTLIDGDTALEKTIVVLE